MCMEFFPAALALAQYDLEVRESPHYWTLELHGVRLCALVHKQD
jgi:hypothetical protein